MRILIIDNRDSFTWNVVQQLSSLGAGCIVLRADTASLEDVKRVRADCIVLSPGPHRPEDAVLSLEVLRVHAGTVPILGICLGMQCMASLFGGRLSVVLAKEPVHGKTSKVFHIGSGIFQDIPSPFVAARYHSLVVQTVPEGFIPLAWTGTQKKPDELMAMMDPKRRCIGVQFHPESFLTEHGSSLMKKFLTHPW